MPNLLLRLGVLAVVVILLLATVGGAWAHSVTPPAPVAAPPVVAPVPLVPPVAVKPPPVRREFRGVWLATVSNIDWPSRPGLTTDEQKAELLLILDRAKALNLNAVLFQVRSACDALYASPFEPWSEVLSGQMGGKPDPYYDPLEFAVTEAHRRGLELHAWFNPFRVRLNADSPNPVSADHVSKIHPYWVRRYGKMLWLDPGELAARDYSLAVVADIVRRYDVDGIHIDDYFYPYKITDASKTEVEFPDDAPWVRYQTSGGTLGRADWRRSNIDDFVERMYRQTKAAKPWVKVGISPFGIWRPGFPAPIKGFDSYEGLYGDSRRWLHEGWADYFSPQLYWPIEQTPQSFPALLAWWASENTLARQLWPGSFTSKASAPTSPDTVWTPEEIEYQIKTTRGIAGATGNVHFSAKFLLSGTIQDPGLPRTLSQTVYAQPALVPASPWLAPEGAAPPQTPIGLTATPSAAGWVVSWRSVPTAALAWQWVIQSRVGGAWSTVILPGDTTTCTIPAPATPGTSDTVAVSAVNRVGALGAPAVAVLPNPPSPFPKRS